MRRFALRTLANRGRLQKLHLSASFEEHFDTENTETFTVNDSNMCITPETEWALNGMYNSFAYMDEYFTSLLNKAMETESTEKKHYHSIDQ